MLSVNVSQLFLISSKINYLFLKLKIKIQNHTLRFSPDDKYVAVGSHDSSVDYFELDAKSGKITRVGYCAQIPGMVLQMDFSNDSNHLRVNQ
jgi:hypothetical protein